MTTRPLITMPTGETGDGTEAAAEASEDVLEDDLLLPLDGATTADGDAQG